MAKYKLPTIKEMLDAGVHFGHQVKRWNPKMEKYIYTVNKGVHIIDLEQTEELLDKACEFLFNEASKGKSVVFVGTKRQSKEIIENEARRCGAMYVTERWIGGTITNLETIKKNIDKLLDFLKGREEERFAKRTKKERLLIDREIEKLQKAYGGIVNMKKEPDVLFIIDPKREKTAVREANRAGVPVVSLIDTNASPEGISYPIPGNDDAIKSAALIVKAIADSIEEGYEEHGKKKDKEEKEKEKKDETPIIVGVQKEEIIEKEVKLVEEVKEEEAEKKIAAESGKKEESKEKPSKKDIKKDKIKK
ncbi:30S ribosomal protein S2 [Patescibacteria group bacterium]